MDDVNTSNTERYLLINIDKNNGTKNNNESDEFEQFKTNNTGRK